MDRVVEDYATSPGGTGARTAEHGSTGASDCVPTKAEWLGPMEPQGIGLAGGAARGATEVAMEGHERTDGTHAQIHPPRPAFERRAVAW